MSLSKDNSFKIWNLKNQVCIFTHVDVVNKLSNFLVINNDVIFGSYDDKIKIYELNVDNEDTEAINTLKKNDILKAKGILKKYSKSKVVSFCMSEDEKIFGILSADSSVEFFKVLSKTELRNRLIATMISKDKNGKKEKLIKNEKFKIMISQTKSLIKSKEYNYCAKYKSLFSYEGLTSKKNNNNHKIFDSLFIDNNTFAVASNKKEQINIIQPKEFCTIVVPFDSSEFGYKLTPKNYIEAIEMKMKNYLRIKNQIKEARLTEEQERAFHMALQGIQCHRQLYSSGHVSSCR